MYVWCRIVFFLLYNNFIPISLYVTIELVNVGQAYLIGSDMELYNEELDTPCAVRSSNLGQELGMYVWHILYVCMCMYVCMYVISSYISIVIIIISRDLGQVSNIFSDKTGR